MKHNKFGKQKGAVKTDQSPASSQKKVFSIQRDDHGADHKSEDLEPKKKLAKLPEVAYDLGSSASEEHSSYTLGSDDSMEDMDEDDYNSSEDSFLDKNVNSSEDSDNEHMTEQADIEEVKPVHKNDDKEADSVQVSTKPIEVKTPPSKEVLKPAATPTKEFTSSGLEAAITTVLLNNADVLAKAILKQIYGASENASPDVAKAKKDVKASPVKLQPKVVVPDISSKPKKSADTPMPKKKHALSNPGFSAGGGGNKNKNRKRKANR
uniref:Uncharacterized protein n=1 Tax=Ditylenchus dipsaci TaxID=166011 RepID=A0A915DPQ2_9BILA